MLSKFRLKMLAVRIEWHWFHIMRDRKKENSLLEKGTAFSSCKLLRINSRLDYHCNRVIRLTCEFNELIKQYQNCGAKNIICKQS